MNLAEKFASVLVHLRGLPDGREKATAITRLEESAYWAALSFEGISSPIDIAAADETAMQLLIPKTRS